MRSRAARRNRSSSATLSRNESPGGRARQSFQALTVDGHRCRSPTCRYSGFGYHAAMGDVGDWIVDNRTWLLSLLAIVISATLAIALYRLNKAKKQIDYQVINDVMILSRHASSLREKLHIEYGSHTLQNPRIVTIKFINTGNKAIEGSDFKQAITVRHGEYDDIRAIDGFIVDQAADGIITEIFDYAAGNKYIQIAPDLLNSREWFIVQFLYDHDEPLRVSCRFKDQTRPMKELLPVSTRAFR